jgi:hypothetical protein
MEDEGSLEREVNEGVESEPDESEALGSVGISAGASEVCQRGPRRALGLPIGSRALM